MEKQVNQTRNVHSYKDDASKAKPERHLPETDTLLNLSSKGSYKDAQQCLKFELFSM